MICLSMFRVPSGLADCHHLFGALDRPHWWTHDCYVPCDRLLLPKEAEGETLRGTQLSYELTEDSNRYVRSCLIYYDCFKSTTTTFGSCIIAAAGVHVANFLAQC